MCLPVCHLRVSWAHAPCCSRKGYHQRFILASLKSSLDQTHISEQNSAFPWQRKTGRKSRRQKDEERTHLKPFNIHDEGDYGGSHKVWDIKPAKRLRGGCHLCWIQASGAPTSQSTQASKHLNLNTELNWSKANEGERTREKRRKGEPGVNGWGSRLWRRAVCRMGRSIDGSEGGTRPTERRNVAGTITHTEKKWH